MESNKPRPVNVSLLRPLPSVKSMLSVCVLVWWSCSVLCLAQNKQTQDKIMLIGKLETFDREAIAQAGKTGDPDFVPVLRSLIPHSKKEFGRVLPSIQIALAKLGETDQIAAILSDLRGDVPRRQNEAVDKLIDIGGPMAITAIMPLLDEDKVRSYKQNPPGICRRDYPLRRYALRALPLLVVNPPVDPETDDISIIGKWVPIDEQVALWKQWYEWHKDSLEVVARKE